MKNDLIENPSSRCACMLVLDTSGSMDGAPIAELNQGLAEFLRTLKDDEVASFSVELCIISTGSGTPRKELDFTIANNVMHIAPLSAYGGTPLGQAVTMALDGLEQRKQSYKSAGVPYFQPWLVLISDGEPTDAWTQAASRARIMSEGKKLVVLPIGVAGANLQKLGECSNRGAKELNGLKFREFFLWLSASMSRVSASASTAASIQLPSTASWDVV